MKLSIIIPVFNEEDILESSVISLINKLNSNFHKTWELILVENGSTDNSKHIAQELSRKYRQIKLYHLPKPSYGQALKFGLLKARGEYLVIFNIDFWDINFLKKGLDLIQTSDIVNASKTLISADDLRPMYRRQLTYWFNAFLKVIYNFPGTDTHGLKIMKANSVRSLIKGCYPLNELFDTQLILRSCKRGLIYTELPVKVKEIRPSRYFNFTRFFRIVHDLAIIFKYRYL